PRTRGRRGASQTGRQVASWGSPRGRIVLRTSILESALLDTIPLSGPLLSQGTWPMPSDLPPVAATAVDPRAVQRKVFWRIVPLLFVLYIVAYLDRANIAFAKLEMEQKLDFLSPKAGGAEVYGWGVGLF